MGEFLYYLVGILGMMTLFFGIAVLIAYVKTKRAGKGWYVTEMDKSGFIYGVIVLVIFAGVASCNML